MIGVHWQNGNLLDIFNVLSLPQYLSVYSGKLAAINVSIIYLHHLIQNASLSLLTTVFTDSLSALQALQTPRQQSAQSLLQSIIYQVYRIEASFLNPFKIPFAWCQGHFHVNGNKIAHQLAQKRTKKETQSSSTDTPSHYSKLYLSSPFWPSFLFLSILERQTSKLANLQ